MHIDNTGCESLNKKKASKEIRSRNVKECLRSEKLSNFEILILNIKNNLLYKSSKPGEIGRSRYDQKDLPAHINRTFTSFGQRKKNPYSVSDVLNEENYRTSDACNQTNLPGSQYNRGYKFPFNKESVFGKVSHADVQGNKTKKLIHSFERGLSLQNINNLSNERQSHTFYPRIKEFQKSNTSNIDEILRETPINWKIVEMKKSLCHINSLRLRLKKRNLCFMDLHDHFSCIDKELSCTVPLNTFYHILKQVNVIPDTKIFEFLLNEFNFITEKSSVYYVDALNLLNWKCEFPSLSKIYDSPEELENYHTTYQDSMKLYK